MPELHEHPRRPRIAGLLPWVVAAVGLATMVVDYVINAIRADKLDESGLSNAHSAVGWFILAGVGFVLLVGGVATGIRGLGGRD